LNKKLPAFHSIVRDDADTNISSWFQEGVVSKCTLILALLLIVFFSASAQQNQPEQKAKPQAPTVSPTDNRGANPVKPTAESLAQGKKYYGYDCVMCHGETGDGKGEVAVSESYSLKDFRDPETLKKYTDQELFDLLKKGKNHMPLEPIRVTPNELWNLINYVRSMAAQPEKK